MANKKNNEFELETKEMELEEVHKEADIDVLSRRFPNQDRERLLEVLSDMSLDDATFLLEDEESLDENEKEVEVKIEEKKPEVIKMQESNQESNGKMSADEQFELLMAEQNKMQKALEKKKGGVVTVDDTGERAERALEIASSGKRRGREFKPTSGVAMFMVKQNAKYKASGKPAPYPTECIRETLKREMGEK